MKSKTFVFDTFKGEKYISAVTNTVFNKLNENLPHLFAFQNFSRLFFMPRCYIFVVFLIVIILEVYHNVKFVIYDDTHLAGLILHTIRIFFR